MFKHISFFALCGFEIPAAVILNMTCCETAMPSLTLLISVCKRIL